MSETATMEHGEQATLLDLNGQEFNTMWVDEGAALFVANNPLHWRAHKLQVLLARMDRQLEKNPAQFNSTTYVGILEKLETAMQEIRAQKHDGSVLGSREVAEGISEPGGAPAIRAGKSDGLDTGISANNPFARQRISPA